VHLSEINFQAMYEQQQQAQAQTQAANAPASTLPQ
jgi:preprotein translocase subunit SecB